MKKKEMEKDSSSSCASSHSCHVLTNVIKSVSFSSFRLVPFSFSFSRGRAARRRTRSGRVLPLLM